MQSPLKLVTRRELKSTYGVPYSLTHLYRLMEAGKFPHSVRLTEHRVAWLARDVEAWIEERAQSRSGRDAPL
jgi:prophage regulatory protein